MEPYDNSGGQGVPPQQFYNNMPVRPVANSMSVVSLILAIVAALSILTGIFPIFFGSLAILFAILGKGNNIRMDKGGRITTAIATVSVIAGLIVTGSTIYEIKYDPEARKALNTTFEQMYGVTFDEYWSGMQQYYETGEMPDFLKPGMNQTTNPGIDPGKVDVL